MSSLAKNKAVCRHRLEEEPSDIVLAGAVLIYSRPNNISLVCAEGMYLRHKPPGRTARIRRRRELRHQPDACIGFECSFQIQT